VNKLPVSVIILTYNEEKSIEACIKSVYEYYDEIFIVDSFSTDRTLDISSKYTHKIYKHKFENYSAQRNWAQDNLLIKNEWVFHLDADERVTPELIDELKTKFTTDIKEISGFLISRKTIFRDKWIKHGGHYPVYHLRLFKKNCGRCEDRLYDQHFYVKGKVLTLKNDILDYYNGDIRSWILKHKKWAYQEACEIIKRNKNNEPSKNNFIIKGYKSGNAIEIRRWLREGYYRLPIFLRPFLYFFYRYILLRGFMDGKEGIIFHFLHGFLYRFIVDMKIYNLKKKGINRKQIDHSRY
jgi:glycosyltransferase involved in cell wall biosynthesis